MSSPIDHVSIAAEIAHETMRAFRNTAHRLMPARAAQDFKPVPPWSEAEDVLQDYARQAVRAMIERPNGVEQLASEAQAQRAPDLLLAVIAAEQALSVMGVQICEAPECDRTGVGGMQ